VIPAGVSFPGVSPSQARQDPSSWTFRIYYAAIAIAAAVYLALHPLSRAVPWPAVLALGVLMMATELLPVVLPRGGFSTPTSAVDMAALVLLGPVTTAWLVCATALVTQLFLLRRPPVRALFNAALFTLTLAGAGAAYESLGGVPGNVVLPEALPALGAAALLYFLVNSLGMSAILSLSQGGSARRIFQRNYLAAAPVHLGHLAIGASAALVYLRVGPWGLVVFLVPLLAAAMGLRRYWEMKHDLLEFVRALTGVLEEVDPYTRAHSHRVAEYAKHVAREVGVPERDVEDIEYGALLHDLGKVGRPFQTILTKPSRLSAEEEMCVRDHPEMGARIVGRIRTLSRVAEYVHCHHERVDGGGYPRGLAQEQIPIGARIITVCDAFDAMTSDRPYRRALPETEAFGELHKHAGSQFDVAVVTALERAFESGRLALLFHREEGTEILPWAARAGA
jgi:putative nucleotidyltransferase with HDIG domain